MRMSMQLVISLICPVCQMAMKEPKLTECGHQFCAGCLIRYSHGQTFSCPVCRTTLDSSKIYPNNALKREILDLKIKCVRHESCDWVGELRNEGAHEGECQYVNEYCTNECGELVMRKDMGDHVDTQCSRRRVRCVHCNVEVKLEEIHDHYEICKLYPVGCVYDCGEILARLQMDRHVDIQGTCPNTPFDCDFKYSGCQFRGKRSDLLKHNESNVVNHLSLVAMELSTTKVQLQTTNEELEDTKKELAETKLKFVGTQQKLADVEMQLHEEINLRSLSLPPHQPRPFIHTWKIENWSEKVLDAKRDINPVRKISSNTFYVYPGYHLYLSTYPNGRKDNSYLSVFLSATEGKFDRDVEWPFPFLFLLKVVDQQSDGIDIYREFSPPYRASLLDPTSDSGWGVPELTSHSTLETRSYIRDNAILIRLIVQVEKSYDQ